MGGASHRAVRIDAAAPSITGLSSLTHAGAQVWYTNRAPSFQWTCTGGSAGVAGYSWVLDHNAGTIPDAAVDGTTITAAYVDVADGLWWFHVRGLAGTGVWGAAQHVALRIDASRPTPNAYSATVKRGKKASMGYRLIDPAGGCGTGTVKIVVKSSRRKVVKRTTIKNAPTNRKRTWKFTCKLKKGRYTVCVSGTDGTGNKGTKTVKARLTVK